MEQILQKLGSSWLGRGHSLCREPRGAPGGWAQGGWQECQEAAGVVRALG